MKNRLYYKNSYQTQFNSTVIKCEPYKENKFILVLENTCFYPEGGGQPSDTGYINDAYVEYVYDKDDTVYHVVNKEFSVGDNIEGKIDWEKRFKYMQIHSGEHIISGIVFQKYGYNNIGFHMDEETATLDFEGELTSEQVDEIEILANKYIYENQPFEILYPDENQLKELQYRSKKELTGDVRITKAGNVDMCACCGTHVHSFGEIGIIKIMESKKHRGGTRMIITCGLPAFQNYKHTFDTTLKISQKLSLPMEKTYQGFEKLLEDIENQKKLLSSLRKRLIKEMADNFQDTEDNIIIFDNQLEGDDLREYALLLLDKTPNFVIILSGEESSYKYVIADHCNAADINNKLKKHLNVRGGGRDNICQGTIMNTEEEILNALNLI